MKEKETIIFVWHENLFYPGGTEKYIVDFGNFISKIYNLICICKGYPSCKIDIKIIKNTKINFKLILCSRSKMLFYLKTAFLLPFILIKEKKLKTIYLLSTSLIFSILTSIPILNIRKVNIVISNHSFFPKIRYLKRDKKTKGLFFHMLALLVLKILTKSKLIKKEKIKIHVLNRIQLKLYKHLGFENTYLIPNYIETKKVRDVVNSKEFIATYIGRIAKDQKGIDVLLEVIKRTLDKNKNIKFYIAGRGEKEWEDKLKELENIYPDNVKYLGFISEEEKYDLLSKSSLFIAPSRWEGMPLSVLEALSEGNICLLSNIPEFRDLLNFDQKFGFICKDTSEYVNRISELYNLWKTDRKAFLEWRKYIQNKALEIFNIEKIAKEFEEKFILNV